METKEYIVILHSHTDLNDFYTDMEQRGYYEHVPNRAVELVYRRPSSRSTHYQLTDDEVQILRQDPRVLDIHRPYYDLGYEVVPCVSQTSSHWSKSDQLTRGTPEVNWGVLRCVEGKKRTNWGSDDNTRVIKKVLATVNLPNTGRHVDLVIVDGHMDPGHPEFAKNPDGTGGSRVIQYKWFKEHWQQVLGTRPTKTVDGVESFNDYEYDFRSSTYRELQVNNHGASSAGVSAGNTCGFARDANIYNISPFWDTTINGFDSGLYYVASFIEEFHKNKKINEATGRRNPTIANMSVGFITPERRNIDEFQEIRYKGKTYTRDDKTGMWDKNAFRKTGAEHPFRGVQVDSRDTSIEQDIMDAIAAGVIFTVAAGNESMYIARPGDDLYDTEFVEAAQNSDGSYNKVYPLRGGALAATPGVICVGALDATVVERKVDYSNKGPRIDIYAPAVNTVSARNTLDDNPILPTNPLTTRPPSQTTCTFDSYPTSVKEGERITFGLTVTGVPSGHRMYWSIVFTTVGPGLADNFDFTDFNFRGEFYWFEVDSSGRGRFTLPITADMWTEGAETFTVHIYDEPNSSGSDAVPNAIAVTNPITIVDTSTGNNSPAGYDSRAPGYFKGIYGGTSSASPHVAGIIACALETYPNMTAAQALSYIQTYADHGLLRDRPLNTDYEADQWLNDEHILFNGPNMHARYQPNTRPNQVHPVIGHQSRPLIGAVYPRFSPNVRRPTPAPITTTTTPAPITTTTTPAPITTATTLAPITTATTLAPLVSTTTPRP